jgi:hypothetical protein
MNKVDRVQNFFSSHDCCYSNRRRKQYNVFFFIHQNRANTNVCVKEKKPREEEEEEGRKDYSSNLFLFVIDKHYNRQCEMNKIQENEHMYIYIRFFFKMN